MTPSFLRLKKGYGASMIKVIAGKYRSRNLLTPEEGTEPTKNRVREAIMSALSDLIPGATVLDLFAGSGALGIECLSRGASSCYFNDANVKTAMLVKKNLQTLKENNGIVSNQDYLAYLNQKGLLPAFDIVFLDPPYALKEAYQESLSLLLNNGLLKENGAIVFEYEGGISVDVTAFAKAKEYTYGKTKVLIARKSL